MMDGSAEQISVTTTRLKYLICKNLINWWLWVE